MKRFKDKFYRTVEITKDIRATYDESCGMGYLYLTEKPLERLPREEKCRHKTLDCWKDGLLIDMRDHCLTGIEFFGLEYMPKWVVDALYSSAADVRECVHVSGNEMGKIQELIANPPQPTEKLKQAMKRHSKIVLDQDLGDE